MMMNKIRTHSLTKLTTGKFYPVPSSLGTGLLLALLLSLPVVTVTYAANISGTEVYVGGFGSVRDNGGSPVTNTSHIAKWDGSNWLALGQGADGDVNAIAIKLKDYNYHLPLIIKS
jgi:hypothetical protein